MNNIIEVIGEDGLKFEVEVLDIFSVKGYDNKDYILYTRNKEIDNNIEVYISILKKNGNEYQLLNIENEEEWKAVQMAVDEMGS